MDSGKIIVLLACFTAIMLSISLVLYIPSSTIYSPYNPSETGLSIFKERYNPSILFRQSSLDEYDTVVLLLDEDIVNTSRYIDFVRGGGRLILLDDEGYANNIFSAMAISINVLNMSVLDEIYKFGDRLHLRGNTSMGNYSIGMYLPSYIEVGGDVEVLVSSSIFSYVDLDGDGNYTVGEPMGSRPLIVRAWYGAGDIVFIGDKEFICNMFLSRDINTLFLDDFLGNGSVALDLSNTEYSSIDLVKKGLEDLGGLGGGIVYGAVLILLSIVGLIVYEELEKA